MKNIPIIMFVLGAVLVNVGIGFFIYYGYLTGGAQSATGTAGWSFAIEGILLTYFGAMAL